MGKKSRGLGRDRSWRDRALALFDAGAAVKDIAALLGIPERSVLAVIVREREGDLDANLQAMTEGLSLPLTPADELSPQERGRIRVAYEDGVPVSYIAREFGLQPLDVFQILVEDQVPLRMWDRNSLRAAYRDYLRAIRAKKAIRMYLEGVPLNVISARLGIAMSQVSYTVKKYNVPRRQPKKGHRRKTPPVEGPILDPLEEYRKKYGELGEYVIKLRGEVSDL